MEANDLLFDTENEEIIKIIQKAVVERANYDLRKIISIAQKLRLKSSTGKKDQYGDEIEDYSKVPTKDLIKLYEEAVSHAFFATPIRLRAFVESSLANIIYEDEYNKALLGATGTQAIRQAEATIAIQNTEFKQIYRKMYAKYVEDVVKSFEQFVRRLERIIDLREKEEKLPFTTFEQSKSK